MKVRELFEKMYNDEMSIPDSHEFGETQELNFEDTDVREAAFAGFLLAMSFTHEHMANAKQAVERLRFAINGPVNVALLALEDEQDTLSNFHYQMAQHQKRTNRELMPEESLWPVEAVVDFDVSCVDQLTAPHSRLAKMPLFTLRRNQHFSIGYLLEFDNLKPIGYTTNRLHMSKSANGENPVQVVTIVLAIRGDDSLYPKEYANSLREAYGSIGKFEKRCRNICPTSEIIPLGSSLNGSVVRALALTLYVSHDQFAKAQK